MEVRKCLEPHLPHGASASLCPAGSFTALDRTALPLNEICPCCRISCLAPSPTAPKASLSSTSQNLPKTDSRRMAQSQWPQEEKLLREEGANRESGIFQKQISNLTILLTNGPSAGSDLIRWVARPFTEPNYAPSSEGIQPTESSGQENPAGDDLLQRRQLPRRLLTVASKLARARSALCATQTCAAELGRGSRGAKEKFNTGVM